MSKYDTLTREQLIADIAAAEATIATLQSSYEATISRVDTLANAVEQLSLQLATISDSQTLSAQDRDELASYRMLGTVADLSTSTATLSEMERQLGDRDITGVLTKLEAYESVGSVAEMSLWRDQAQDSLTDAQVRSRAAIEAIKARYTSEAGGIPRGLITFNGLTPSSSVLPWVARPFASLKAVAKTAGEHVIAPTTWFEPARGLRVGVLLPSGTMTALIAVHAKVSVRTLDSEEIATVGIGHFLRSYGGHFCVPNSMQQSATSKQAVVINVAYAPPDWKGCALPQGETCAAWFVDQDTAIVAVSFVGANIIGAAALQDVFAGLLLMSTSHVIVRAKIGAVAAVVNADCGRQTDQRQYVTAASAGMKAVGVLGALSDNYILTQPPARVAERLSDNTPVSELQQLIDVLV